VCLKTPIHILTSRNWNILHDLLVIHSVKKFPYFKETDGSFLSSREAWGPILSHPEPSWGHSGFTVRLISSLPISFKIQLNIHIPLRLGLQICPFLSVHLSWYFQTSTISSMRATCAAYLIRRDFNIFHFPCVTFKRNAGQFVHFITIVICPYIFRLKWAIFGENQVQSDTKNGNFWNA
jgi:hypothetical protein